jgi:hypothetical protein
MFRIVGVNQIEQLLMFAAVGATALLSYVCFLMVISQSSGSESISRQSMSSCGHQSIRQPYVMWRTGAIGLAPLLITLEGHSSLEGHSCCESVTVSKLAQRQRSSHQHPVPLIFCGHVCLQLAARCPELSGPLVARTAWSFAALRHVSPALTAALHRRAIQLALQQQLGGLDAVQLLRAAAKMAAQDSSALFQACSQVGSLDLNIYVV